MPMSEIFTLWKVRDELQCVNGFSAKRSPLLRD
jgi:hypothetical protein